MKKEELLINNYKVKVLINNTRTNGVKELQFELQFFNLVYYRAFVIDYLLYKHYESVIYVIKNFIDTFIKSLKESEYLKMMCYENRIKISEIDYEGIREDIWKCVRKLEERC